MNKSLCQYFALVMGIAFVLAAIGGFLPGITLMPVPDDAHHLAIEHSHGYLLGLFPVNAIHNLFHLVAGIFGLIAHRRYSSSRAYCRGLAVVLGALTILGMFPHTSTLFSVMPIHGHDVWLHGLEAIVAAYLGFGNPSDVQKPERAKTSVETEHETISPFLRWVTAIEVGVLIVAGGGLFFFPDITAPMWPWTLKPFNARFLGAVYLGSMVSAFSLVAYGRWVPARTVTPMIALFTFVVLTVSILYFDRFDGPLSSILLWFVLYVGIPVNALFHLWIYRHRSVPASFDSGRKTRILLMGQVLALGTYGAGLLALPAIFSSFWPWPLDSLHARMYSVAYLTPALGALIQLRVATRPGLIVLGATQLTGGALAIAGVVLVDLQVMRIDWGAVGTWAWIAHFAAIALLGAAMFRVAQVRPRHSTGIRFPPISAIDGNPSRDSKVSPRS